MNPGSRRFADGASALSGERADAGDGVLRLRAEGSLGRDDGFEPIRPPASQLCPVAGLDLGLTFGFAELGLIVNDLADAWKG